jgi:hypothetical protein
VGHRILGPVVAALLATIPGLLVPGAVAPASAAVVAACPGATGVTVIVDYNEIGGPTRAGCAPDGGGDSAAQAFSDAGFSLEYHPRQPGYVCKVTGLPTDRPCLENNSFWSLWWSAGKSGRWVFSNQGVGGLTVPDGGYVAFAWHEGAGNAQPPDVVPTAHETPEPSEEPSDDDTNGGDHGGDNGGTNGGTNDGGSSNGGSQTTSAPPTASAPPTSASATESASDTVSPGRGKTRRDRESDEPSESATSSDATPAAGEITDGPPSSDLGADSSDDDGGSLPTWIGIGLAVLVLGAAGAVTLVRRRSG